MDETEKLPQSYTSIPKLRLSKHNEWPRSKISDACFGRSTYFYRKFQAVTQRTKTPKPQNTKTLKKHSSFITHRSSLKKLATNARMVLPLSTHENTQTLKHKNTQKTFIVHHSSFIVKKNASFLPNRIARSGLR